MDASPKVAVPLPVGKLGLSGIGTTTTVDYKNVLYIFGNSLEVEKRTKSTAIVRYAGHRMAFGYRARLIGSLVYY